MNCQYKCADCEHSDHHWMEAFPDPDDPDDPSYIPEAVAAWRAEVEFEPDRAPLAPVYLICKHCGEWRWFDESDEGDEPDLWGDA